jgi:hypothetical protein
MGAISTSGVIHIVGELAKQVEHETSVRRRRWGCFVTEMFLRHSRADVSDFVSLVLKFLLSRVTDLDAAVLRAASTSKACKP